MNEQAIRDAYEAIVRLTARELAELNRRIQRGGEGGAGVREPRRPRPSAPSREEAA